MATAIAGAIGDPTSLATAEKAGVNSTPTIKWTSRFSQPFKSLAKRAKDKKEKESIERGEYVEGRLTQSPVQ